MKMTPAHYNQLASAVNGILAQYPNTFKDYEGKGLSPMRYRWDLYHAVCDKDNFKLARELYEYCNDDHIDSALRKITGTK